MLGFTQSTGNMRCSAVVAAFSSVKAIECVGCSSRVHECSDLMAST